MTLKGGKVEKILILDDDEAIRSLYAMALEDLQQLYYWDDQIRTSIFGPSFNRSGEKSELELN